MLSDPFIFSCTLISLICCEATAVKKSKNSLESSSSLLAGFVDSWHHRSSHPFKIIFHAYEDHRFLRTFFMETKLRQKKTWISQCERGIRGLRNRDFPSLSYLNQFSLTCFCDDYFCLFLAFKINCHKTFTQLAIVQSFCLSYPLPPILKEKISELSRFVSDTVPRIFKNMIFFICVIWSR